MPFVFSVWEPSSNYGGIAVHNWLAKIIGRKWSVFIIMINISLQAANNLELMCQPGQHSHDGK
jgi:hypothetical protein